MGRKSSRETAMKMLFQYEFQNENREEQLLSVFEEEEFSEGDKKYIRDVLNGVKDNIENIDVMIEKYSKGWKFSRMSKVDIAILRLGIFELTFRHDIPTNVAINEAIELAKKYSAEESGSFVNGILGKITKQSEAKVGSDISLPNTDEEDEK